MNGKNEIGIDLQNGHFTVNGVDVAFQNFSDLDVPYRLIYFIKDKVKKQYHIGAQVTHQGKNLQRIVEVGNSQEVVIHA